MNGPLLCISQFFLYFPIFHFTVSISWNPNIYPKNAYAPDYEIPNTYEVILALLGKRSANPTSCLPQERAQHEIVLNQQGDEVCIESYNHRFLARLLVYIKLRQYSNIHLRNNRIPQSKESRLICSTPTKIFLMQKIRIKS